MSPDIQHDPAMEEFIAVEDDEPKMVVEQSSFRTVDLRDPEEFEDDLLSEVTGPVDGRGGIGASIPVKGKWIHGWLESRGEDYINSIYKNWLHFTTYIKARTRQFINTSEFNIRQGSYENMYRYILVLEDLGLVSRTRSEDVPLEEYDHFVPERMRQRRYVSIDVPFEENPEAWTRPHNTLYDSPEEADEEVDVEPMEEPEEPEEPEPPGRGSIDDFTPDPSGVQDIADDQITIDDYPRLGELQQSVTTQFGNAAEGAFDSATIEYEEILPTDYTLGRVAVIGVWVTGDATPESDGLDIVMSIDGELAELQPGFLPGAIGSRYRSIILNDHNEWFPDVGVTAVYDNAFSDTLEMAMAGQEPQIYYDLLNGNFVEQS